MMRDIWEKFRAAVGISGGNDRTPPTLPAPDHAAAGEGLSPQDLAAAGDEGSVGDLLSAPPDDLILLHIPSPADDARTCVLSRRWRHTWTHLPELRFPLHAEPALTLPSPAATCAALAVYAAPVLRLLSVVANDADPRDVAAVLRLAAPRLTGELFFQNVVPEDREDEEEMVYYQFLMEALTLLPVENLQLQLVTSGHAVMSCVFHFLKISTSIRRLSVHISEGIQEQTACAPGCICYQPQDWKTEELCLNSLQELHICGLNGADHDLAFVKRLLGWTPVLKTVDINFDPSATVDEELCKELHDLSRPETCMKFYLYRNAV